MTNKTAIVTGASGNMGQAIVKKFLDEGYNVIGTVVSNDPVTLDINNNKFEKIVVDLMNEGDCGNFINRIVEKYETIDVVITTVGGFTKGTITETKSADILKQYKLNFETAYNIARPVFIKMLQQNSGRIFLVGSRPGIDAQHGKGMIAYGIAKSLLFRLAELMNEEAMDKNVVTAVLVPGTIDTPQNRKAMPNSDFNNWVSVETIAETVIYYCSDSAAALREPVIKLYNNS